MRIATLGPEGTFSNEAVLKYKKGANIVFKKTIWDVFEAIKLKEADLGIVPLENSIAGTEGPTLDALMDFELNIIAELVLDIKHNLASYGSIKDIKTVYAHPQAYAQCERYLRENIPNAEVIHTSSNGKSAELLAKGKKKDKAAIVPKLAAQKYKLKLVREEIQDSKFNVTRFIVIGENGTRKTGKDRTSIAIYPQVDRPGLLYELLGEFAQRRINLTKIESRPSKGKLGDYLFFIDMQGHKDEKRIKDAFTIIKKSFLLKILGSYPRKY
jgi:prephenate dehydratase